MKEYNSILSNHKEIIKQDNKQIEVSLKALMQNQSEKIELLAKEIKQLK